MDVQCEHDHGGGMRQRGADAAADAPAAPAADAPKGPDTGAHRKNRRRTCWRIFLASPYYKLCVLSLMSVVPVFGNIMAMPKLLDGRGCTGLLDRALNYAVTIWISVMFIYNFVMTQFTDPGGCASVKPPHETTGQYELVLDEVGENGVKDGSERLALLYAPSWCELCQHWKTPRSHHCSICQRCVLRMDHHCPITGNCIGIKNHGHFIIMYLFSFLGLSYSMGSCIVVILRGHWEQSPEARALQAEIHNYTKNLMGIPGLMIQVFLKILVAAGAEVAMQTVFTAIACIFVLACGCPAVAMASSNTTLLEMQFPMKEYVQLKPQVYCPLGPGFYMRSRRENLQELFGERWLIRLLLPVRGGPLSVQPAIAPRPSPLGASTLRERVVQVEEKGVTKHVNSCSELGINLGPGGSGSAGV